MLFLWLFVAATTVQLTFWGLVFRRLGPVAERLWAMDKERRAKGGGQRAKGGGQETDGQGTGGLPTADCPLAPSSRPPVLPSPALPLSVIICAHNEADNLRQNLPHFLGQDYPLFEILVVDDNSDDKTAEVVLSFQKEFPILRLLILDQPTAPGKKEALEAGVRAARFDTLLFSDADCRPRSPHWIAQMAAALGTENEIALGYSPYERRPGWLNRFQRFETIYTAIQYFSFALIGMPYMGVGRNLAYRRELFRCTGGLRSHAHLMSGDDDLFVNRAAKAGKTVPVLHPDAFVLSSPTLSWRGYYHQKFRHNTAGSHYRPLHQAVLGLLSLSHLAHYALGPAAVLLTGQWQLVLLMYLVRLSVVASVWRSAVRHLGDRDLLPFVPLFDGLFPLYYCLFAPALITGRSLEQWKQ